MACDLIDYCQFFNDNMKDMPKAAEYVRSKLCHGDHQHCNRYRMYQQLGGLDIQCDPNPSDAEVVEKLIHALYERRLLED